MKLRIIFENSPTTTKVERFLLNLGLNQTQFNVKTEFETTGVELVVPMAFVTVNLIGVDENIVRQVFDMMNQLVNIEIAGFDLLNNGKRVK